MTLSFTSIANPETTDRTSGPTLGRDEMAVYDALVRADAALTLDDLRTQLGSVRLGCDLLADLPDAIASLEQDGLVWRDGNLVGLCE